MRISTLTFQQDAASQMQALEADLAKTQQQLGSGKRIQSAADDPTGMAQVNQLSVRLAASQQYVTNGNAVTANLQLEEQALSDATNVLQSARDLAVQANNSALSADQRQDIATQLQQQLQSLIGIGNRADSNGNYLFSGYASHTRPFAQSGGTVTYAGATGVSQVQISANLRISGGDTGASAFMNIPAGNGTFTTSAAAANTGTASIEPGSITDPTAWIADTYTISFTDPATYQVTDSEGNVVTTGTYANGGTIAFRGAQVTLNGAPAAGDQFTVAPAGTASVFSTLTNLVAALGTPNADAAQLTTQVSGALNQIDNAITHFSDVSASVGARLNTVTTAQSAAQTIQTSITTNISKLSSVDYAAATTRLASEELSLQAAQESYVSLSKLSLFNYLS